MLCIDQHFNSRQFQIIDVYAGHDSEMRVVPLLRLLNTSVRIYGCSISALSFNIMVICSCSIDFNQLLDYAQMVGHIIGVSVDSWMYTST